MVVRPDLMIWQIPMQRRRWMTFRPNTAKCFIDKPDQATLCFHVYFLPLKT